MTTSESDTSQLKNRKALFPVTKAVLNRAGKTASALTGTQQALSQLIGQVKQARKREKLEATAKGPLNEKTKEHLSKVLDPSKAAWGSHREAEDNREKELSSSPRLPAQWKLDNEEDATNAVKLPMAIDWDLLEDGPDKTSQPHGGFKDISKLLIEPAEEGESPTKKPDRPSAVFQTVSRDDLSSRSTVAASEPGRYEPKWKSVRRREPSALIVDRTLLRTKTVTDGRDFRQSDLQEHVPAPHIGTHTSRETPGFGRMMSKVGMAEQKAIFNSSVDHGFKDVMYDTSPYWERGPGKHHVNVPDMARAEGRRDQHADHSMLVARTYPAVNGHSSWTAKSPILKTVADLGHTADMSRMIGRREAAKGWHEEDRLDYRVDEPYVGEGVGNTDNLRGPVPLGKMVSRDKTAQAVREAQLVACSPQRFGVAEDPTLARNHKVVPFAKLLPRDTSELRSSAPDAVYNVAKAQDALQRKRAASPHFRRMSSRKALQATAAPPSAFISYPKADKPKLHSPSVDLSRTGGHASLVDRGREWAAAQDVPGRVPLSSTGSKVQASGYAWHPSDTPLRVPHVPAPDLSAGGKARPSMAKKAAVDRTYDTARGLSMIESRARTVMIGSGPAGQGRQADEMKAERGRLEEEVRLIIQSKPPTKLMPH